MGLKQQQEELEKSFQEVKADILEVFVPILMPIIQWLDLIIKKIR